MPSVISSHRMVTSACCVAIVAVACGVSTSANEASDVATRELLKKFNDEFVEVTPGSGKFPAKFLMGSKDSSENETPAHEVVLSRPFAMAKYEVPQNLYEAVMGNNPSRWKGPRNSAEMFAFDDAVEFCERATRLMRDAGLLKANESIRLPTEVEWEYCCRAGTGTAYSFGNLAVKPTDRANQASLLDEYGWHTGNAAGNDPPVGAKKPNPWGLYDMHGYLWEFVADDWHPSYEGAPSDGSVWGAGKPDVQHVIRGGSWKDRHEHHRSSTRRPLDKGAKDDAVGFRCVRQ